MNATQHVTARQIVEIDAAREIADARAQLEGAERALARALANLGRVQSREGFRQEADAPDVVGAAEMVRSGMAQVGQARELID